MAQTSVLGLSAVKTARGIRPIVAKRFDCFCCDEAMQDRVVEIKSRPIVSAEERLLLAMTALAQSSIASKDEQPCLALP